MLPLIPALATVAAVIEKVLDVKDSKEKLKSLPITAERFIAHYNSFSRTLLQKCKKKMKI